MKKMYYLGILGLIITSIGYIAFNWFSSYEITVLIDTTDKQEYQLQSDDIISVIHMYDNMWSRRKVHISTLSNYEYNAVNSMSLHAQFFLLSNPNTRKKEITTFSSQMQSELTTIYQETMGKPKSTLYEPIIREANRLSVSKERNKILIIQSDLQENSQIFSSYRIEDIALLQKNPDKVKEQFSKIIAPLQLDHLRVYFIHQPTSDGDNARFVAMAKFYKQLFEQSGATVFIGSNIFHE